MISILAIVPKARFSPEAAQEEGRRYLEDFGQAMKEEMSEYPPNQPWSSVPPKNGPRAGGRRTGAYGDGWRNAPIRVTNNSMTVVNTVSYAGVVGGVNQSRVLEGRGWKRVDEVAREVRRYNLPRYSRVIWQ
jgi:hypothetical protein